ncbi:MAG: MFS transporter [Brachybacterium sp.]|nr:MFS transporter [Brachybacterium sp.]
MHRGAVISLTTAVALGVAVFFTLYSLIPVTRADDPGLSSLFVGTMMAFVMAVQVFTPALVRRFSLRLVLTVSLALLAIGALVTGTAQTTVVLLVGAVLSGAGFGIVIVAGAQGIALLVPAQQLGRVLGIYGLVTMAATALGSPAGVQLALAYSTSVFGVCAFIVGVLAAGLSLRLPPGVGTSDPDPDPTMTPDAPEGGRVQRFVAGAPWLALALLLAVVVLFSHGLTSLPVLASSFGGAALVVFTVQLGNALGRGIGGELEARIEAPAALVVGSLSLAAGGVLGVLVSVAAAMLASGVLIGLGVGIVQTLTLHTTMRRMDPGRASVVWNLGVDGGLWVGGILWGLALASGTVGAGSIVVSVMALALGVAVALRLRRPA